MGITYSSLKCILLSKQVHGVSFVNTAMIGRLSLYVTGRPLKKALSFCYPSIRDSDIKDIESCGGYSEELLRFLGAKTVDSLDVSDYEGASIIHDMSIPIPEKYNNKFSLVMDGGTFEHVYRCTVAFENSMKMVKPEGHLIICTPTNQQSGHGFYQFSPELFYSLLSNENGFAVQEMLLIEENGRISKVKSPFDTHCRVELFTRSPSLLFVVAQKIGPTPSEPAVFQSDYIATWEGAAPKGYFTSIPNFIKNLVPSQARRGLKSLLFPRSRPTQRVNLEHILKNLME